MTMKKNKILQIAVVFVLISTFLLTSTFAYAENSKAQFGKETVTADGVVIREPPKDWNALTATDEELAYYGYPARPTDKNQLNDWEKAVGTQWIKPSFEKRHKKLNETHGSVANPIASTNWAGVISRVYSTTVSGYWIVPSVTVDTHYKPAASCSWIGLGGNTNSPTLIQAGSDSNVDIYGKEKYYLWYELNYGKNLSWYNESNYINLENFKKGDTIYCSISYNPTTKSAYFYIADLSTNKSTSFSKVVKYEGNVTANADWVIEHPNATGPENTLYPYLANFNYCHFWNCQSGTTGSGGTYSYVKDSASTTDYITMYSDILKTKTLAYPMAIGYTGDFYINWLNYNWYNNN